MLPIETINKTYNRNCCAAEATFNFQLNRQLKCRMTRRGFFFSLSIFLTLMDLYQVPRLNIYILFIQEILVTRSSLLPIDKFGNRHAHTAHRATNIWLCSADLCFLRNSRFAYSLQFLLLLLLQFPLLTLLFVVGRFQCEQLIFVPFYGGNLLPFNLCIIRFQLFRARVIRNIVNVTIRRKDLAYLARLLYTYTRLTVHILIIVARVYIFPF